jgi:hypothetical protein
MDDMIRVDDIDAFNELMSDVFDYIFRNWVVASFNPIAQIVLALLHNDIRLEFGCKGGVDLDDMLVFWQFFQYLKLSL